MTASDIHDTALRMLGRRALSRREVAERLTRKGFATDAVAAEVRRLDSLGMLDDDGLACAVVRSAARSGHGRHALRAALRRRRLPRDAEQTALAGLDSDELDAALAAAIRRGERRFPQWRHLPEARRKMVRYLLARGFGAAEARRALLERSRGSSESDEAVEPADPPDVS